MKRHYTVPNVREVVSAKTVGPATDESRVSPKQSQGERVAASVLARPDARADAAPKGFSRKRRP